MERDVRTSGLTGALLCTGASILLCGCLLPSLETGEVQQGAEDASLEAGLDAEPQQEAQAEADASQETQEEASFSQCGHFKNMQSSCAECLDSTCCEQANACRNDVSCAALYDCIAACETKDAACRSQCFHTHLDSLPQGGFPLEACLNVNCHEQCGSCGGFYNTYPIGCGSCLEKECCDSLSSCTENEDCVAISQCFESCLNPWCFTSCQKGKSAIIFGQTRACSYSKCRSECWGGSWECLDKYAWPSPPISDKFVKVTLHVTNPIEGLMAPAVGLTVKACRAKSPGCEETDLPTDVTDAAGVAILENVPVVDKAPFMGFFKATGPGFFPSLIFFSDVIVEDAELDCTVLPESYGDTIKAAVGSEVDASKSSIVPAIRDCAVAFAPGIQFTLTGQTAQPVYAGLNGLFEKGLDKTTRLGIAAFINVDPGNYHVVAALASNQQEVADLSVLTLPGYFSFVFLLPSAKP